MEVAIGCDPNAVDYTEKLITALKESGHDVLQFNETDPIYANTAIAVASCVAHGGADRGILICGTGIGMCIAANKVKGAYAALLSDVYSAERSVKSNNANIACFGAFTIGYCVMEKLAMTWLDTLYESGSPSEPKIDCYVRYDEER